MNLGRAFAYLLAAHVQALALILMAIYGGRYLNERYPADFDWFIVTVPVAVLAILQTGYVVLRTAFRQKHSNETARKDRRDD